MDLVNLECDDEVIPSTSTIVGKMPATSANALSMAETISTFEDLHFSSAMFFSPPFVYDLVIFNLSDHIEFLWSCCIILHNLGNCGAKAPPDRQTGRTKDAQNILREKRESPCIDMISGRELHLDREMRR